MRIAEECFNQGEWYPMAEHVTADYIWAPGFINYLIVQLKLFGTLHFNMILNLILQMAILWLIYKIGIYFFSKQTARIGIILWCLLYSNWLVVAPAGTEIPFLFLCLSGFYLILHPKLSFYMIAGILFAVANWIRPIMIIFLLTAVIFMVWKKTNWKYYAVLIFSLAVSIGFIGKTTEKRFGYFVYQSTTGGVNLIMTSNDKAYGGVASSVMTDPDNIAYIPEKGLLTFQQKDSIWKARSVEWILENPGKASWLYLKKIVGLYVEDSWADRPLLGGHGMIDSYVVAGKISKQQFVLQVISRVLKSFAYYIVMIIFLYTIYKQRKKIFTFPYLILLSLLAIGTAITCLLAVSPRYHYPFLFVIVLFAAFGIENYIKEKKNRQQSSN